MQDLALKVYVKMQSLGSSLTSSLRNNWKNEDGQDMVEYAIVLGLIAMGATVAMKGLATTIGTGFTSIGTKLTTYTS